MVFEVPAPSLTMTKKHFSLLWIYILGTAIQADVREREDFREAPTAELG